MRFGKFDIADIEAEIESFDRWILLVVNCLWNGIVIFFLIPYANIYLVGAQSLVKSGQVVTLIENPTRT